MKQALILFIILTTLEVAGQTSNIEHGQISDSFKSSLISDLEKRNFGLKNNDIKSIYFYSHPFELNGKTYKSFEEECLLHIESMKRDSIRIKDFQVISISNIYHCKGEYQTIILLKTTMQMKQDEFSFERKLIANSLDGHNWKFVTSGETDLKKMIKLFPFLCPEQE